VLWANPDNPQEAFTNQPQPGYTPMQKDPKTGQWQVIRGWKPPEQTGEDGGITSDKRVAIRTATQGKQIDINLKRNKYINDGLRGRMAVDPSLPSDPVRQQQLKAELAAEFDAANPGAVKPVHQDPAAGVEPPAAGITPQNPQGQPPQQQAPQQPPQAAPQAQAPVAQQSPPQQQQAPPQTAQHPALPHIPPHDIPRVEQQLARKPLDQWTTQDFILQAAIYQAKGVRLPTREEVMKQKDRQSPQNGNPKVADNSNMTLEEAQRILGIPAG